MKAKDSGPNVRRHSVYFTSFLGVVPYYNNFHFGYPVVFLYATGWLSLTFSTTVCYILSYRYYSYVCRTLISHIQDIEIRK